jgi:hypothetical protein
MKLETAQLHFKSSPEWLKTELINEFGKEAFDDKPYTDIKSFEDACKVLNISSDIPVFYGKNCKSLTALYKLQIIIEAINGEWVCDFSNTKQKKFYNWFTVDPTGLTFISSKSHNGFDISTIIGNSSLYFETSEKADYYRKQFNDMYIDYLLN